MTPVQELAAAFIEEINFLLSPEEIQEVNRKNETWEHCATHEFCDPNEAMAAAYFRMYAKHIDASDDMDLINDAWTLARKQQFSLYLVNHAIAVDDLREWAQTFAEEFPNQESDNQVTFDYIMDLADKLENYTASALEYSEIVFHLNQKRGLS
jgi:hypothetical protein